MNSPDNQSNSSFVSSKKFSIIIGIVFLLVAGLVVGENTGLIKVSVLSDKQVPAFDGTTTPVLKVPNWVALSSNEWDLEYDNIPTSKMIPLPEYDPKRLKTSVESLGWSSSSDLAIRNEKITYSVPYMGNYELDGHEFAGSHLAVDIKIPNNTPIYAIGNGIVSKISEQGTGFGHHIVIKHPNFPTLTSSSKSNTIYSSYSHMGKLTVKEGDIVLKGDKIGYSGDSGTATTPHLHFQIDNDKAPWHPYWPFTYKEASDAGLSFFEAVNAGLGKEKAMETTINPMLFIQKYMDSSGSIEQPEPVTNTNQPQYEPDSSELPPSTVDDNNDEPELDEIEEIVEEEVEEVEIIPEPVESKPEKYLLDANGTFVENEPINIKIKAVDDKEKVVKTYTPPRSVVVKLLEGKASIPLAVSSGDFKEGEAEFAITPKTSDSIKIKVSDNSIEGESFLMKSGLFTDIGYDHKNYEAIKFLKDTGIIKGYPDGSYKPDQVVSRVEALKIILEASRSNLITARELPFPDTSANEWYSDYVVTAFNKKIIDGYPDGKFKPANTVNRAEFLKILFNGLDLDLEENVKKDLYKDVPREEWFAKYVQYGKERYLVVDKSTRYFLPEEGMTRADVAETVYRTLMMVLSEKEKYSSGVVATEEAVEDYFG
ncbi:peptidoglycan DD-metalloendopeptidase family protein [Candidatus Peregrinibacteria bacterium]|nr:peptidoglycan DD-metalloendopeptidase family protein [Candidatus Peregrinibacteria bacterium]